MKSYFIEDLNSKQIKKIKTLLEEQDCYNPIKDIFWVKLPQKILSITQEKHNKTCGPYIFSIEIGKNWIKAEFLIRDTKKISCSCIRFAEEHQRNYIINFIDAILNHI